MNKILNSIYEILRKPLFPLKHERSDGLPYWRERILYTFAFAGLYVGIIALVPSVIASFHSNVQIIAVVDIFVYLYLVFIFTYSGISFSFRVNSLLVIIYLLSVILILILGPYGAGIMWQFTVPLIAGMLFGLKPAINALIINAVTLILFGIIIYFNFFPAFLISEYSFNGYIAVSINFLALNIFFSLSLGVLMDGLDNTLSEEKRLLQKINDEKLVMERLKEKAEASDKIKTAFLTNISHDIRTPLNAILGFTQLMNSKNLTKPVQERYNSIIMSQGQTLLHLIDDIIDIAKIEAGEVVINKQQFSLKVLLDELFVFFENQIKLKKQDGVKFLLQVDNTIPENIFQDPGRLRQILINLIGNAVKFTYKGYILVKVEKYDLQNLIFAIEDTGIGIPNDKQNIIFDRFRQVDESPTKKHGGTGLGLSICKSLVGMLGGFIWVESELNKGSTFYFKLPVS